MISIELFSIIPVCPFDYFAALRTPSVIGSATAQFKTKNKFGVLKIIMDRLKVSQCWLYLVHCMGWVFSSLVDLPVRSTCSILINQLIN